MNSPLCVALWSIAFPGFGQILNGRLIKGLVFIGLEILVNVNANINEVIILSFTGSWADAINIANYQWIMFYPCIYTFSIWDAYCDAGGGKSPYTVLPTVFSAYFGTLGVVFSRDGVVLAPFGPVLLGLLGMFIGVAFGWLAKAVLEKKLTSNKQSGCRKKSYP